MNIEGEGHRRLGAPQVAPAPRDRVPNLHAELSGVPRGAAVRTTAAAPYRAAIFNWGIATRCRSGMVIRVIALSDRECAQYPGIVPLRCQPLAGMCAVGGVATPEEREGPTGPRHQWSLRLPAGWHRVSRPDRVSAKMLRLSKCRARSVRERSEIGEYQSVPEGSLGAGDRGPESEPSTAAQMDEGHGRRYTLLGLLADAQVGVWPVRSKRTWEPSVGEGWESGRTIKFADRGRRRGGGLLGGLALASGPTGMVTGASGPSLCWGWG